MPLIFFVIKRQLPHYRWSPVLGELINIQLMDTMTTQTHNTLTITQGMILGGNQTQDMLPNVRWKGKHHSHFAILAIKYIINRQIRIDVFSVDRETIRHAKVK